MDRLDRATVSRPAGQTLPAPVPGGPVYAVDVATQRVLQSTTLQENGVLRATARAFNWWGGSGVIYFVALLWLGGRAARRRRTAHLGLRCAEGIAVSSAISGIIKGLAGRARPFATPGEPWHWGFAHGWVDARYFSMPSGHTTVLFAATAALIVTTARTQPLPRLAMVGAALASALVVAFARVYSDQHWMSDVFVGAVLGSLTGYFVARWHLRHQGSSFDRAMLGTYTAS